MKKYVNECKINKDNFLYKEATAPDLTLLKLPVIPKHYGEAIISAQHIQLNHPLPGQHEAILKRNFYLLGAPKIIKKICKKCLLCQSNKKLPAERPIFSSSSVPTNPSSNLGADVFKWFGQNILVITDDLTSFVQAQHVKSEQKTDLCEGIIKMVLPIKISPTTDIRTDTAPGLRAVLDNQTLDKHGIKIVLGDKKCKNSLAITDRAIQLLQEEIRKMNTSGGKVTPSVLAQEVNVVNSRLRPSKNNLSPKELLFKTDPVSYTHLTLPTNREV